MDAHIGQCHRQHSPAPEPTRQANHQSPTEHALHADEVVGIEQLEQCYQPPTLPPHSTIIEINVHLGVETQELRGERNNEEHRQQQHIDDTIDPQVFGRTFQAEQAEAPLSQFAEQTEHQHDKHRSEHKRPHQLQVGFVSERDAMLVSPLHIAIEALPRPVDRQ